MALIVNDIIFENSISGNTLSANTIFSGGTDINSIFTSTAATSNNTTQINNKANKSGDTFTGNVNINANLVVTGTTNVQTLSASTFFSGSSDISTFFNQDRIQLNNKANKSGDTFTGNVNINANLVVTGTTLIQLLSATTILSAGTDLYAIFATNASSTATTFIQNGINTFTGGTPSRPTVNITGATLNNLNVTGTGAVNIVNLSGGTISGGTFYSGNSDFNTIIKNSHLATKANLISGSSFTGSPKVVSVIFTTPYPSTAYTISIVGVASRNWTYQDKTASAFTINANANTVFTTEVSWSTIAVGEL